MMLLTVESLIALTSIGTDAVQGPTDWNNN